jgi:hypothetical protein
MKPATGILMLEQCAMRNLFPKSNRSVAILQDVILGDSHTTISLAVV